MSWDLKISQYNDLIFSPNRDLTVTTGEDLLAQRIMLRLRMQRGSWIFDTSKSLGSNLVFALRMNAHQALADIHAIVLEALDPISDEIQVVDVQTQLSDDERSIQLAVAYQRILPPEQADLPIIENPNLVLTIPIT